MSQAVGDCPFRPSVHFGVLIKSLQIVYVMELVWFLESRSNALALCQASGPSEAYLTPHV